MLCLRKQAEIFIIQKLDELDLGLLGYFRRYLGACFRAFLVAFF